MLITCLYSRGVHLKTLDAMDTASFKMAFQRFQDVTEECVYLRSDAGSNFMKARNEGEEINDAVLQDARSKWEHEGKIWDVNPPRASHFGGVWERMIGKIREIIKGYLLPMGNRLLNREEFITMLLHAALMINSTSLW